MSRAASSLQRLGASCDFSRSDSAPEGESFPALGSGAMGGGGRRGRHRLGPRSTRNDINPFFGEASRITSIKAQLQHCA